jgi:hypothetical protein
MANNTPINQGATYTFRNTTAYAKGALVVIPYGYSTTPAFQGPIPFMINPETITETLQGGWVHKQVPGQNDPVTCWVGNGSRTLGLTLLLIKDQSSYSPATSTGQTSTTNPSVTSVLGSIAQSALRIPLPIFNNKPVEPAAATIGTVKTIDISAELDQLRQLRYGELYKNGLYSTPPSLVKLQFDGLNTPTIPNVSNPSLGINSNTLGNVYWTVDSLEISIIKWSATLQPLEAEVKLTLVQFNDINRSRALTTGSASGNSNVNIGQINDVPASAAAITTA